MIRNTLIKVSTGEEDGGADGFGVGDWEQRSLKFRVFGLEGKFGNCNGEKVLEGEKLEESEILGEGLMGFGDCVSIWRS